VIDHFVAGLPQLLSQLVLDLEANMVRRQVNAHPVILPGAFARNTQPTVRRQKDLPGSTACQVST
jgi:hypothetical protein